MKKKSKYFGVVILIIFFCNSKEQIFTASNTMKLSPLTIQNDTTEILKILIDSAFYRQNLPDFSKLIQNNPFGDTVIFKFNKILVGHLPQDRKFKILTEEDICSLATKYRNDSVGVFNLLELKNFKKTNNSFDVSLKNECVMPLYDKNGRPRFKKSFYKTYKNFKCLYGYMCGGGISMKFLKQASGMKAKINGFWSN